MAATPYLGNPLATQSPSAPPGLGASLTVSIPAGTDVRTIESIKQQIQASADFINYRSLAGARFHDDFLDATSVLANRYTSVDGGTGTHTVVDDSAQGSFGAFKHNCSGGIGNNSLTHATFPVGITTGDFMLRMAIRVPTQGANCLVQIGFTNGGAGNRLFFQLNGAVANWTLKVDGVTPAPLATVAVTTTTYQTLIILRQNGILTMAVGGTVLYQAADVVNRNDGFPSVFTQDGVLFMDYWGL